jgi:hypothetical protein
MAEMHSDATSTPHGHERRDFNIRVVALFALSMAVVLAGSLALMAWVFDLLHVTPAGHAPLGAPIAATPPRPLAPRLQTSPRQELQALRRAEDAHLQSYGWVDRALGIVRMPIDRAMARVVEQGLPSWHEIPTPPTDVRGAIPEKQP